MRKILLALVIVSLVAMPTFAVQNVKVGGSINTTYLNRTQFDLGGAVGGASVEKQSVFFTQTKLDVSADLTDNVSTTVQLINERAWDNKTSSTDTNVDLNLAYVTLKEMLYSPLTVVVGRQAFSYGNSFIVSTGGTSAADSGLANVVGDFSDQTGMDAIRAILDYNPLKVELLYAKIDGGNLNFQRKYLDTDDVDLLGVNAAMNLAIPKKTMVEAYFFAKVDAINYADEDGDDKKDKTYVPGIRVSTNPIERLNLQAEYAHQFGQKSNDGVGVAEQKRMANAAQFIATLQLPVGEKLEKYAPVAGYTYTYVQGPKADLNKTTAWDPLFENQNNGTIFNTLFQLTNVHAQSLSLQADPVEDVTAKLTWWNLRLDKAVKAVGDLAILRPDGSAAIGNLGLVEKKALGNEFDFDLSYRYTEDVTIGASLGWFNPGKAFKQGARDTATQAMVNLKVNF